MAEHVRQAKRGPAFCDPPGNSFYRAPPGGTSCYGDQTKCLLRSQQFVRAGCHRP